MVQRIFELMEKNEINATELAKATGIGTSPISQWKKGLQKPSTDAVIKIADFFGTSTDYLLGRTDNKEPVNTPGKKKEPTMRLVNKKENDNMDKRRINKDQAKHAIMICFENAELIPPLGSQARSEFDVSSEEAKIKKFSKSTKIPYERVVRFIDIVLNESEFEDEHYPTLTEMESIYIVSNVQDDSENITKWENAKKEVEKFINMLEREYKLIKREEADSGIVERLRNLESTVGVISDIIGGLTAEIGDIRKDTEALEEGQLKQNYTKISAALGKIQQLMSA